MVFIEKYNNSKSVIKQVFTQVKEEKSNMNYSDYMENNVAVPKTLENANEK